MNRACTLFPTVFLLQCMLCCSIGSYGQFAPPAGHPGTTAIHQDSSAIIAWANTCSIQRGYIDIADTTVLYNGFNKASYGSYLYGSGPADDLVVSLGDGGSAVLGFDIPVVNLTGPDFAIFENSFGDSFLELAFVEVSSDNQRYVRFPAISLTQSDNQVGTFDTLDATKINNLAGKYRHAYGTPFDLEDLKDSAGVDLNHITSIRILDVVGSITSPFCSFDSQGHKINDPWPTPFDTGGFDLDAVGVIHNQNSGIDDVPQDSAIRLFPNPVSDILNFTSKSSGRIVLNVTDLTGKSLLTREMKKKISIDLSSLPAGIYLARFTMDDGNTATKKIVRK